QTVRIRNTPITIIGVLEAKGQAGMGQDQDDVILAPATTVLYRLKGHQWVDMINASAVSTDQIPAAQVELTRILREAHRLNDGDPNDFTISTQAEITATVTETTPTMTL